MFNSKKSSGNSGNKIKTFKGGFSSKPTYRKKKVNKPSTSADLHLSVDKVSISDFRSDEATKRIDPIINRILNNGQKVHVRIKNNQESLKEEILRDSDGTMTNLMEKLIKNDQFNKNIQKNILDVVVVDPNEVKNHYQEFIDAIYECINENKDTPTKSIIVSAILKIYLKFGYKPLEEFLETTSKGLNKTINNSFVNKLSYGLMSIMDSTVWNAPKNGEIKPNCYKVPIRAIILELSYSMANMLQEAKVMGNTFKF